MPSFAEAAGDAKPAFELGSGCWGTRRQWRRRKLCASQYPIGCPSPAQPTAIGVGGCYGIAARKRHDSTGRHCPGLSTATVLRDKRRLRQGGYVIVAVEIDEMK